MIISRTPLRISFVGGGTDLRSFYGEEPGQVLSTSIDKYIFNELSLKSKYEIINLKKYLDENMYYDSLHLNKLGHKNVAVKISDELEKIIKNN